MQILAGDLTPFVWIEDFLCEFLDLTKGDLGVFCNLTHHLLMIEKQKNISQIKKYCSFHEGDYTRLTDTATPYFSCLW